MALSINTNIAATNAYRNLSATQGDLSSSLEKLSSGFRINRAADDAAGLAISEGLRAQVGGLKVASRNAQDGISVVQTAEGALNETHSILQRMRDLSVQAANDGALNSEAKTNIQTEIGQLKEEITRIADTTTFNDHKLLKGEYSGTFQVGANVGETISVSVGQAMDAEGLNIADIDVTQAGAAAVAEVLDEDGEVLTEAVAAEESGAEKAIRAIDAAISDVSTVRSDLGAKQNRFDHTINNLNVASENLSASESRIRDTDMAQEMVSFTRSQILSQAGTSMLAQANQLPQGVLSLLR